MLDFSSCIFTFKKLNDPYSINYHTKQINDCDIENINNKEQQDDDEEDQDEQPNSASLTRPSTCTAPKYDPNSFVNRSLRMIKLYQTLRDELVKSQETCFGTYSAWRINEMRVNI